MCNRFFLLASNHNERKTDKIIFDKNDLSLSLFLFGDISSLKSERKGRGTWFPVIYMSVTSLLLNCSHHYSLSILKRQLERVSL